MQSHTVTFHHMPSYVTTCHLFTSHRITLSYQIIWQQIKLHHITSHAITCHHITSHQITSHQITSYQIISLQIIKHQITLHHMPSQFYQNLIGPFLTTRTTRRLNLDRRLQRHGRASQPEQVGRSPDTAGKLRQLRYRNRISNRTTIWLKMLATVIIIFAAVSGGVIKSDAS